MLKPTKHDQWLIEREMCSSRKYPYSPHRRDWKFLGGGGFSKAQKFKSMYEAFETGISREVGESQRKNPFRGEGMDNFWNHTMLLE